MKLKIDQYKWSDLKNTERKKIRKEMNITLGICKTLLKVLTYISPRKKGEWYYGRK